MERRVSEPRVRASCIAILLIACAFGSAACEDDKRAPPAPAGGSKIGTMAGSIQQPPGGGAGDGSSGTGSVITSAPDAGGAGSGGILRDASVLDVLPGTGGTSAEPTDFLDSGVR